MSKREIRRQRTKDDETETSTTTTTTTQKIQKTKRNRHAPVGVEEGVVVADGIEAEADLLGAQRRAGVVPREELHGALLLLDLLLDLCLVGWLWGVWTVVVRVGRSDGVAVAGRAGAHPPTHLLLECKEGYLRAALAGVGEDFLRGDVDLRVVQHLERARRLQELIYCRLGWCGVVVLGIVGGEGWF